MSTEPVKHRFTVAEYEAMGAAGLFHPDQRLELIEGEVVEMAPIGPPHAGVVNRLNRILGRAVGDRAIVSVQSPMRLSDISEPQPDVLVLAPRLDFYGLRHPFPDDVLLAIEVADTTLRWDRTTKALLYARGGVPELWVVDVNGRTVEVSTSPGSDGYADTRRAGVEDMIALSGLEGVAVRVADILG